MKLKTTAIADVFELQLSPIVDDRGFFARTFCPAKLTELGVHFTPTQINMSRNTARHTLRGMHFQPAPYAEAKIVRCTRGRIYDVVADIRPESPTYKRWTTIELDADQANAIIIPEGCAHGFLTLAPECDVVYQMGRSYVPGHARGFRYDDPSFAIHWPERPAIISAADLDWPPYSID
jgi:dTDP-4-dehydrorhamnose 3,5-epimerase